MAEDRSSRRKPLGDGVLLGGTTFSIGTSYHSTKLSSLPLLIRFFALHTKAPSANMSKGLPVKDGSLSYANFNAIRSYRIRIM